MQYNYTYNQKQNGNKDSYRTLLLLFAKLLLIIFITFLVMLINISKVAAQAGQLDPSFNSADHGVAVTEGADNDVRTLALQSDGKIIIGGLFNSFAGIAANRITRINADGSKDAAFNTGGAGADGPVYKVLLQPDGKIIVAGKFNNYNGAAAGKIVRLNADGSKDATFNTGTGFNDSVNVVSRQADGKILVGGNFTTFNGTAANYLVRLNADGTRDALFNPVAVNSTVNDIATQVDNKVIVGMQGSGYLVRLTSAGAADATFNVASASLTGPVRVLRLQTDGKLLTGGIAAYPNSSLVRLNTDATPDASFTSGLQTQVNAITLQSDGKILVSAGEFYEKYQYMAGKKMYRLNTNGTADAAFNYSFDPTHLNQNIFDITVQPDGKILSAESTKWQVSFRDVTGPYYLSIRDPKIRRYNSNGSDDINFAVNSAATGSARKINATALQSDGKLLVGGYFYTFNGAIANHIIRLNANGTPDATFNTGSGFDYAVNAIAVQPDGKIIVAGYFEKYNGQPYSKIIRLNSNGSADASFAGTLSNVNWVTTISIQPDGKIVLGGSVPGVLMRLNANGSVDASFNVTLMNTLPYDLPEVLATVLQPDGKILAGGHYSRVSGSDPALVGRMVRFNTNGTRDTSFNGRYVDDNGNATFIGPNADVRAIGLQADGKVIIGGSFLSYITYNSNTAANRIVRLTSNGIVDPSFNVGTGVNGDVNSIVVLPSGKVIIAGNFTSYNGTSVGGLIRLNPNGSLDNTFNNAGAGANAAAINSLLVEPGAARLYIAGDFTSYNATGKNRLARIFNDDSGAPLAPITTTATICASELPYVWNGNNYTTTGIYTASVGHPGGITIDTLKLTVGAGNITGPDRACQFITAGTNAVYQITAPAGSTITWAVSAASTMSIAGGQGTSQVTVHFANNFSAGAVSAHVVNASCSLNVNRSLTVKITAPAAPGAITAGNNSICSVVGTTNTISYKINKVASAASYNWTAQAGSTTITHPNGPGVNDTIINVSFANNFSSSQITVQAVNDCGTSGTRTLSVTRAVPATPAAINGPAYVCAYLMPAPAGGPAVYTTPAVAGLAYNWAIPAGASSVTGQGTNSISFYFPAGFTTGSVSVTATNGCGSSIAKVMNVKASVPQTPGGITATLVSDCPNRIYTYSIAAIPADATSILWNVPAGATITSGQGTATLTVSYSTTAISGYVSLHAYNACGSSNIRKIAVNFAACSPAPPTPFAKAENAGNATANTTNPASSMLTKTANTATVIEGMEVKLFPNPSSGAFNLEVLAPGKEEITIKIMDVAGRFISQQIIKPYQTARIGASLKTGMYLIEVRQAETVKTASVIKL